MLRFLEKIGSEVLYLLETAGRMGIFLGICIGRILTPPYKLGPIVGQIHFIGARSLFVIIFTGAFTGMVLGLQGYYTLRKFGSEGLLGSAVALSLLRELGPVLTALMVIGRAGSAITAEIGIMRNSEQIDALECMAIDPFRYLLVPKFLGGLVAIPLLTFIFDAVGIIGGWAVGVGMLGVNQGTFFQSMYKAVAWHDINMGIIKGFVFALVVIWICSVKGFYLHLERSGGFGAEGVSRTTTSAVVLASVSILIWDYLISAMMI
ncbi:MAG: MlaE family lipid ABC transporter permease subunit [Geothermobacteraceae bacterium]